MKLKTLSTLLLALAISVGCSTSQKTVKNQPEQKPSEPKTEKETPDRRKELKRIPGQALKHKFEDKTVYIIISAVSRGEKSSKLLYTVGRKGVKGERDKCIVWNRPVKIENGKIKFPAGTVWEISKVSSTEIDFHFPPGPVVKEPKTVRYKKTDEHALKNCEVTNDVREFSEEEEKSI
jgi:hypothetical protein